MEGSIITFSVIFLIVTAAGAALLKNLEDTVNEIAEKWGWIPKRCVYSAYIIVGIIITAGVGWLWCLLLIIFPS